MMGRRTFLSYMSGMVAVVTGPAAAQRAILEGSKTVVCSDQPLTCPVCKQKTCPTINATLMVGNDNHEYPDSSQLFDYHIVRCDNCHAAFFRE